MSIAGLQGFIDRVFLCIFVLLDVSGAFFAFGSLTSTYLPRSKAYSRNFAVVVERQECSGVIGEKPVLSVGLEASSSTPGRLS